MPISSLQERDFFFLPPPPTGRCLGRQLRTFQRLRTAGFSPPGLAPNHTKSQRWPRPPNEEAQHDGDRTAGEPPTRFWDSIFGRAGIACEGVFRRPIPPCNHRRRCPPARAILSIFAAVFISALLFSSCSKSWQMMLGLTHQEKIIPTSASSIICIGYKSIDAHLQHEASWGSLTFWECAASRRYGSEDLGG